MGRWRAAVAEAASETAAKGDDGYVFGLFPALLSDDEVDFKGKRVAMPAQTRIDG
jgi:hypothetical protein